MPWSDKWEYRRLMQFSFHLATADLENSNNIKSAYLWNMGDSNMLNDNIFDNIFDIIVLCRIQINHPTIFYVTNDERRRILRIIQDRNSDSQLVSDQ